MNNQSFKNLWDTAANSPCPTDESIKYANYSKISPYNPSEHNISNSDSPKDNNKKFFGGRLNNLLTIHDLSVKFVKKDLIIAIIAISIYYFVGFAYYHRKVDFT